MRTTGVAALALLLAGCGGAGQADETKPSPSPTVDACAAAFDQVAVVTDTLRARVTIRVAHQSADRLDTFVEDVSDACPAAVAADYEASVDTLAEVVDDWSACAVQVCDFAEIGKRLDAAIQDVEESDPPSS